MIAPIRECSVSSALPLASNVDLAVRNAVARADAQQKADAARDYAKNLELAVSEIASVLPALDPKGELAPGAKVSYFADAIVSIGGNSCEAKVALLNGLRAELTARGYQPSSSTDFFEERPLRNAFANLPARVAVGLTWSLGIGPAVPVKNDGCRD